MGGRWEGNKSWHHVDGYAAQNIRSGDNKSCTVTLEQGETCIINALTPYTVKPKQHQYYEGQLSPHSQGYSPP